MCSILLDPITRRPKVFTSSGSEKTTSVAVERTSLPHYGKIYYIPQTCDRVNGEQHPYGSDPQ